MMGASQDLPELVAAALANAKTIQDSIAEIQIAMDEKSSSAARSGELSEAIVSLELIAVDIFAVFEARMQNHFKRGPFSRKLKSLLLASGQTDLADRVHQFYLAINVLKHGKGASYRELLDAPGTFLVVKPSKDANAEAESTGLVDVNAPGFFDGLAATILEARDFLENRGDQTG